MSLQTNTYTCGVSAFLPRGNLCDAQWPKGFQGKHLAAVCNHGIQLKVVVEFGDLKQQGKWQWQLNRSRDSCDPGTPG